VRRPIFGPTQRSSHVVHGAFNVLLLICATWEDLCVFLFVPFWVVSRVSTTCSVELMNTVIVK
jgi:hypothetical protein